MSERILVSLLGVVAILAAIPQVMFLPWGIVLVLLWLIAGAMGKSGDATDRIVIWFLTQMCARFSPSRSAAPWEEAADVLVPANQR